MSSEDLTDNSSPQNPSGKEPDFHHLVEHLTDPFIILNDLGDICFMNPAARKLLDKGLKERVEAHLESRPDKRPDSTVKMPLPSGRYIYLRIKLSPIQWMGKPSMLAALQDVTPYLSAIEEFREKISELEHQEEPATPDDKQPGGKAKTEALEQATSKIGADYNYYVERLIDPFVILNDRCKIVFMNPTAHVLLDKELKNRVEGHLANRTDDSAVSQVRFPFEDGSEVVLELELSRIEWKDKPAMFAALRDVSSYVAAFEHARDSKRSYASLLQSIPAATYLATPDEASTMLFIGPQVDGMLGYPREAWRDDKRSWRRFIHKNDRDAVLRDLARCIENGEQFSAEYRITSKSGDIVWLREEARTTTYEHDKGTYLAGVLLDITKQRRVEEGLKVGRDRLQAWAKRKTRKLESLNDRLLQELTDSKHTADQLQAEHDRLEEQAKERTEQLEKAKHYYYMLMGWDRETGVPLAEKLEDLDIGWAIPEIEGLK